MLSTIISVMQLRGVQRNCTAMRVAPAIMLMRDESDESVNIGSSLNAKNINGKPKLLLYHFYAPIFRFACLGVI